MVRQAKEICWTLFQPYHRLLILLICCQIILTTTAFGDSFELFKLIKGLEQVYTYQALQYSWSFSSYTSITDSGLAECRLVDSATLNDTTVAWTVVEKKNVVRRTVASLPPTDTTYSVSDSASFILHEYTTGHHELRSPSLVWEFPVSFQNGQTFPLFRYSDSSHAVVVCFGYGCPRFANDDYDTLWFSSDSGLFKRSYSRCFDHDEYGWATWRNVTLLSRTLVSVGKTDRLPAHLKLLHNYPNPFNPTTTISYDVPKASEVQLGVYDVLGRQVAVVVEGIQQPGRHEHLFDASHLGSGVYFVRLFGLGAVQTCKMMLMK
jgi:hypothetical protein